MQFAVQNLTDEFVDVLDFPVDVLLEHAEALGGVEDLEGGHSAE